MMKNFLLFVSLIFMASCFGPIVDSNRLERAENLCMDDCGSEIAKWDCGKIVTREECKIRLILAEDSCRFGCILYLKNLVEEAGK